ncbi:hypothetical protein Vafri_19992, partial [Volvox africanus]
GAGAGAGAGNVKALPGTAGGPAGSSSKAVRGQSQSEGAKGGGRSGGYGGGKGNAAPAAGKAGGKGSERAAALPPPPPPPPPPAAQRGKKGKQAKVKEKYADQDAEERALALAVLGSAGEKKSRTDRRKERKERREAVRQEGRTALLGDEDERRQAIERATGKQFVRQEGGADDDVDVGDSDDVEVRVEEVEEDQSEEAAAGGEQADGVGAGSGVGEDGGEQAEEEGPGADVATEAERAEIAALLAEENVEVALADEDAARLSVLDSLTGLPRPEDLLLYAVPVCGPYNAIQSYKFKVKVTPGTVKKGKAARQAIELLIRGLDVGPRERDVLKAVPEMEAINALVGPGVKLSMPGLQKLRADDKKTKKARAQARVVGQTQVQGQVGDAT